MSKLMLKIERSIMGITKNYLIKYATEDIVPVIKKTILDDYHVSLNDKVMDKKSRVRPELYMTLFSERLDDFEFIKSGTSEVIISVPDMETFDFGGALSIIQTILEGTSGVYVEVDENQYIKMYKKSPTILNPFNPDMPKRDRIYLLKYNSEVKKRLFASNIDVVIFPFSNVPPIDIFGRASLLVKKRLLGDIIQKATRSATKEFTETFRT